jgi:hypothetical protein
VTHLLNQPFTVLVAFSTAIIQCQCDAKTVLPLHGLNKPTQCPACQKVFAIAGSGPLNIGQLVNAPEAPRVTL